MSRVEDLRRLLDMIEQIQRLVDEETSTDDGRHVCTACRDFLTDDGRCGCLVGEFRNVLIAAAPEALRDLLDVYEAARTLMDTAPGAGTSYPDGLGGSIVRTSEYRALRAALARVGGRDG